MKGFIYCLAGLLLASANAYSVTVEQARASYRYVIDLQRANGSLREIDADVLAEHSKRLNEALDTFSTGPAGYRMLLEAHLNAEKMLIKRARLVDEPYDVFALQRSLDRLDALIPSLEHGQGNILYTAGHIASHILDDNVLGNRYWFSCAKLDHAGCMNIMASSYESGQGTTPLDETQAVYWHKEVVNTGTRARCAGGFSATSLASLQFTGMETGERVEFWLEKADNLLQQVVDVEDNPHACNAIEVDLLRWLFTHDETALHNLNAFEFDTTSDYGMSRNLVRDALLQASDFSVYSEIMPAIVDDYQRCKAAGLFALKVYDKPDELRLIQRYLRELPPIECGVSLSTVNRLLSLNY